jgi:uncharacterized protein YjiS (DUF1127 family)
MSVTVIKDRETPLGAIGRWWHRWKARRSAVAELDRFDTGDMAHLAQDVGVTPSDLRTLAGRWPDSAELLHRRMAAVGLDEDRVARDEPQALRDLQRVCSECADSTRCRHDLNRDPDDAAWRDYCPNVQTMDALETEREGERLEGRKRKWRSF